MPFRIERIEPHIEQYDWEFMAFTLYLDEPLPVGLQTRLKELLRGWFWMGYYRHFGGALLLMSDVGFEDNIIEWGLDMSHVVPDPLVALQALLQVLEQFAAVEKLGIKNLVIGNELIE